MEIVAFLAPWVLVGIAVVYFAFQGGMSRARRRRSGADGRLLRAVFVPLFLVLALLIPGLVIADFGESRGGDGSIASARLTKEQEQGRDRFRQSCASCHTLQAANARGVTGPNLDELGAIDEQRVLTAIRVGGSGEKRMPAGLLQGQSAAAVASYVSAVSGSR